MTSPPGLAPEEPRAKPAGGAPTAASERATERSLLRRTVWALVAALVAVFLVLAVLSQIGDLPSIDWRLDPAWLALSVVCLVCLHAITAEAWRRILGALGSPLSVRRGWEIWSVALLARYVPTQLVMVATRVSMAQRDGVPRRVTLASIVYEFILASGSALALSIWFIFGLEAVRDSPFRWLILALPVAMLACLHPRIFDRIFTLIAHRLGSERLPETIPVPKVALFGAVYLLSFLVGGLGVFAFAHSLFAVDGFPLEAVIGAYAVGYTGAVLAFFIPGGLGVREGGSVAVLTAAGIPVGVGLAAAVAVRLVQIGVEVGYAAVTSLTRRVTAAPRSAAPRG